MRYYLDTEFIEDGKTIDLISIGIVCEDGREFYAINSWCDFSKASTWVKENVISKLPDQYVNPQTASPSEIQGMLYWKDRPTIVKEVADFFGCVGEVSPVEPVGFRKLMRRVHSVSPVWVSRILQFAGLFAYHSKLETKYTVFGEKPEPWAYYADYDWVAFCQLFGTMMDLPKGFPMYCRDIKQWCDMLGNPKLPEQGKGEHNALEDARWNKVAWEFLDGLGRDDYQMNYP
jgi:hypothetical protein